MARWTAGAKWGEAPAPDGQRDMPLALSLSEGLGRIRDVRGLGRRKESFAAEQREGCSACIRP